MDGFVSNECGLFLFFAETMAAAAAIPTGPNKNAFKKLNCTIVNESKTTEIFEETRQ